MGKYLDKEGVKRIWQYTNQRIEKENKAILDKLGIKEIFTAEDYTAEYDSGYVDDWTPFKLPFTNIKKGEKFSVYIQKSTQDISVLFYNKEKRPLSAFQKSDTTPCSFTFEITDDSEELYLIISPSDSTITVHNVVVVRGDTPLTWEQAENNIPFITRDEAKETFDTKEEVDKKINVALGNYNTNGYDSVDMGEAGIWATCNIGASKPEETGLYFAWGETVGYPDVNSGKSFNWNDYKFGVKPNFTKYNKKDGLTTLEPEDDAAHVNMGGSWRMPTNEEFQKLIDLCNIEWTDDYEGTGIKGTILKLKTDESKQLFFPAAGYCFNGSITNEENNPSGVCWSSTVQFDSICDRSYYLYCAKNTEVISIIRSRGFNIRGFIPPLKYLTKEKADRTYQKKLTPGKNIEITDDNTINCNLHLNIFKLVDKLPEVGEENKIYLVPNVSIVNNSNKYEEWAYFEGAWELLGSVNSSEVDIDLSAYVKKNDLPFEINNEGIYREDSGYKAIQYGYDCFAPGWQACAIGEYLNATCAHEFAIGRYNISRNTEGDPDIFDPNNCLEDDVSMTLFSIGNGTDEQRNNALEIEQDGSIYFHDLNHPNVGDYLKAPTCRLQDHVFSNSTMKRRLDDGFVYSISQSASDEDIQLTVFKYRYSNLTATVTSASSIITLDAATGNTAGLFKAVDKRNFDKIGANVLTLRINYKNDNPVVNSTDINNILSVWADNRGIAGSFTLKNRINIEFDSYDYSHVTYPCSIGGDQNYILLTFIIPSDDEEDMKFFKVTINKYNKTATVKYLGSALSFLNKK